MGPATGSHADIDVLSPAPDRRLWIGGDCGLSQLLPAPGERGRRIRVQLEAKTLAHASVWAVCYDLNGNLWIGTSNGAVRIARPGFITYTAADGLAASVVTSIAQSQSGQPYVDCSLNGQHVIAWFDGRRFVSFKPRLPKRLSSYEWGPGHSTLQDREGEWWLPTSHGLIRFPKLDRLDQLAGSLPKAVYDVADGLPGNNIFHIYEDRNGDLWLSVAGDVPARVVRWERSTGRFRAYSEADGLPPSQSYYPNTFCEDHAGNLWLGFEGGGVARKTGRRFKFYSTADGVPEGDIAYMCTDSSGRLWLASSTSGLGRIDDPGADEPRFASFTTANGLSSNRVSCILEAQANVFYVATTRGVDYFDLNSGRHRRFTTADGLASEQATQIFGDRSGAIWVVTEQGVSRLPFEVTSPQATCPVFITALLVNGINQHVSRLGETEMREIELAASQDNIQIDFTSLSFASGEVIRYQYRLEGADRDWSAAATERRVNYANLKPGGYRFLVRSVNAEGKESTNPASVEFRLLAPVYQRLWFIALAAAATAAAIYLLYRYRIAQFIKLERVRMRIATDLHDDIGSSLSQIAILSEVARHQLNSGGPAAGEPLSVIAQTSRELVDSMSDIVWAINPRRDSLRDLVQRMRQFATDVLTSREIEFDFNAPIDNDSLKLSTDVRREVFLVFKEAVNNLARHSLCSRADVELRIEGGTLVLRVADDGRGFDNSQESRGHGLFGMRQRAKSAGGQLEVVSGRELGTRVTLRVLIDARRRFLFKKRLRE